MKYIFANLKRFDIPKEMDGINGLARSVGGEAV